MHYISIPSCKSYLQIVLTVTSKLFLRNCCHCTETTMTNHYTTHSLKVKQLLKGNSSKTFTKHYQPTTPTRFCEQQHSLHCKHCTNYTSCILDCNIHKLLLRWLQPTKLNCTISHQLHIQEIYVPTRYCNYSFQSQTSTIHHPHCKLVPASTLLFQPP